MPPAMRAQVVHEQEVAPSRRDGDTADVRVTLDAGRGSERLEQRVIRFARGRSQPQLLDGVQGLLYVVSGTGTLIIGSERYEVEPDLGAYLLNGESFEADNPGPEELLTVLVMSLQSNPFIPSPDPRIVRYADRESLPAGKDREFRYLVNEEAGCLDVTQFVGLIPPGKAPEHSHTYDEVIYVIDGEGVFHVDGTEEPMRPGTCIHLPPLVPHCLENRGESNLRVLGVFHPSGDPASRAGGANNGDPPTSNQIPRGKEGE